MKWRAENVARKFRRVKARTNRPIPFDHTMNDIRLSCDYCGEEYDGISEAELAALVEDGWQNVTKLDQSDNPLDWETHGGVCPECAREKL